MILLRGFPETWYCWSHQIQALAARYRVMAPDLRGYGETAKPQNGYDKRTMARDVINLMEHLGLSRVALVGHDRGARVAARFARDYPHGHQLRSYGREDSARTLVLHLQQRSRYP